MALKKRGNLLSLEGIFYKISVLIRLNIYIKKRQHWTIYVNTYTNELFNKGSITFFISNIF